MTTTPLPKPKVPSKGDKKIRLDKDVPEIDRGRFRTPGALARALADSDKLFKSARRTVTPGSVPFDKFGRIDVESLVTDRELSLRIRITCNPKYMCEPHDLVPVMMETRTDVFAFVIAVLEPTRQANFYQIDVVYSLIDLAAALGVTLRSDVPRLKAIQDAYPELGVKAQWLADTTGGGNQANHVSGGVFEKGGSGKIILRPRTMEDFTATAGVRNLEWNMAERLTRAGGRPVYLAFDDILAENKELATTIEAESEFMCAPSVLARVTGTMDVLTGRMSEEASLDLLSVMSTKERDGIKIICPSMIEMKKEVKTYVDTYYDIALPSSAACPLLSNRIVLRRRHVDTDPPGTFLFTLKGASCSFGADKLRHAAQVNLIENVADTPEGMLRVRDLLCDTLGDNAFALCFRQAMVDRGLADLVDDPDWVLEPRLVVTSTRDKYSMKFTDNTVLDFSADTAVGTFGGHSATVCSFELGVGHPGLTTAGTTTFASMDSQIAFWGQKGSFSQRGKEQRPLITRPYHIWQDVCNKSVPHKSDYVFFCVVRDLLLRRYFAIAEGELAPGGNKGSELAAMLGIIER